MSIQIDNNIDNHVDNTILECLKLDEPKSFFLFAGAGSGKTRSLVNILTKLKEKYERRLHLNAQNIAVITYTNAACDEIKHRLGYNSLFSVSTIHSFTWDLIKNFQSDIKLWLEINLKSEISDLEEKESKGRQGTKTSIDRTKKINLKKDRLENLKNIKKFTYNPNSDNRSRDSLNHTEVIQITAYFLNNKQLMQKILIKKYPILLIDESQDTNKLLIDAFFNIQKKHLRHFSLGLFGDTMQRIYNDGKVNLGQNIPSDWERPEKKMNHRCPKRVIQLINKIRSDIDKQEQIPRIEKEEGIVRLFIISNNIENKIEIENEITKEMANITKDNLWDSLDIKTLTLEHHMAAKRMGFLNLFQPLYSHDKLKTGLLDGTLSSMQLFTKVILPLIKAKKEGDEFTVSHIIRKFSPLLDTSLLQKSDNQIESIKKINIYVNELYSLWDNEKDPRIIDVLQYVAKSKLFPIPEMLNPIAHRTKEEQTIAENENDNNHLINALDNALSGPFSQIESYDKYFSEQSRFGTHQGIKGLEFPRVMLIISDEESKGFLFSYEKLFGAKELTKTDLENQQAGKDTSLDRTRRLFYVACSRAEKSLAIVAYTQNPKSVKEHVISEGWFDEKEVVIKEVNR
ncbi:UvrD-helicase domain-containing protein [Malaciobacter sp. WC5094]